MAKGHENLIPTNRRSKDEVRENARRGGIKSGERRREKRAMREWVKLFGEKDITIRNHDGSEEKTDYNGAVVAAIYQKAIAEGDMRAAEMIAKMNGLFEDKLKIEGEMKGVQIVVKSDDEAQKLEAVLNDDY